MTSHSTPIDKLRPGKPSVPNEELPPGKPSGPSEEQPPGKPSVPSEELPPGKPSVPSEKQRPGKPPVPSEKPLINRDIPESVDYIANHYGSAVLPEIHALWENGMFCDIKFEVNSKVFSCHRVIVAAVSDYFRRLLRSVNKRRIRIRNIREEIFAEIVRFAYTGRITLTENNVFEMMFACHHFEMTELTTACGEYASGLIYPGNCFEVIDFARELSVPSLYRKAIELVEQNQDTFFVEPDVCDNRMDSAMAFFNDRTIRIKRNGVPITSTTREMYFMQFLVTFASINPELLEDFADYLKLVNMPLLPEVRWTQILRTQRHILDNALVQHLLQSSELFRNGKGHEDIPSIWNSEPDRSWNLSTSKAMTHQTTFENLPLKAAFNDMSEIEPDTTVMSIEFHFRSILKSIMFLVGIKSVYSNGRTVCHGKCTKSGARPTGDLSVTHTLSPTIVLKEKELIVAVDVLFGCGIHGISLHTNTGSTHGPLGYNKPIRGSHHIRYKVPTTGPYDHLHGFCGTEVELANLTEEPIILNLAAVWASFDSGRGVGQL